MTPIGAPQANPLANPLANDSLAGLTVLITRPRGRGELLAEAIRAAAGQVREVPLLAVAPLDLTTDADLCAATAAKLRQLDRYDMVIAISTNAVEQGLRWASVFWPQWPAGPRWFGIGAATAEALAGWGVSGAAPAIGMNTEALLAQPELQQPIGKHILILRGVGGRETLATALRERGAHVDYAECYRRIEPVLDAAERALLAEPVDAICVNSAETLTNLWNNLPAAAQPSICRHALIVPSSRVADKARELGFKHVVVAENAGTTATLAALATLASPFAAPAQCRTEQGSERD